jgi:hypothetical protein
MAAHNLTFVPIKCGNVIDDVGYYKIVKTPQPPPFEAATATRDSIVRLFRLQRQISMTLSEGGLRFL